MKNKIPKVGGITLKKWIWTIVAVVIIAVVGGVAFTGHHMTQKAYSTAMMTGKEAVNKKNYSIAESSFQEALRHRTNDKQAQGYLTQTQNFVSAESAMSDHEFGTAKSDYTKVKNAKTGLSTLNKRAKTALTLLKTVQLKAEMFQDVYDQALTQNQGQSYEASNATLDRIFKDAEAKEPYYTDIYNKAVDHVALIIKPSRMAVTALQHQHKHKSLIVQQVPTVQLQAAPVVHQV